MLTAGATIVAGLVVFGVAAVIIIRGELRGTLDSALRQRAADVAELAVSAPGILTSPGALESPVSGRQIAVEVLDARGRLLARSLALGDYVLPVDRLVRRALRTGQAGFEGVRVNGAPYRMYVAPIADVGGPAAGGAVLVASDDADIDQTIGRLGLVVALTGVGAALLSILAAGLLTGRGLRPLRRLAAAGEQIERTADPSRRLPEADRTDEIGQLARVLNRMLDALEQARENERRFLADASHELRTPVAALLGNVEYLARHGSSAEVVADLERDAQRLARLVDDLLVLERASVGEPQGGTVDLEELVERLVEERGPRVCAERLEPVSVPGDRDALGRALGNLIDNALIHGPPGGSVWVSVRREGAWALVSVRDEGPGPDPAHRERLFERFWRGPEAAERPGSGLGLPIVAAVAACHHGRVSVAGSTFTIELPARVGSPPRPLTVG